MNVIVTLPLFLPDASEKENGKFQGIGVDLSLVPPKLLAFLYLVPLLIYAQLFGCNLHRVTPFYC